MFAASSLPQMGVLCAALCSFAAGQDKSLHNNESGTVAGDPKLASIVSQVEAAQAENRTKVPYQIIRKYRVFPSSNPNAASEVVAEVDFRPPNTKNYVIQARSGSSHAEEAVRRILDREVEASAQGRPIPTASMLRDNYDVTYLGEDLVEGHSCFLLGLAPKRKDKNLISGRGWVDERLFLIRQIDGDLVKTPSWWVKKVHMRLVFDDVGGTWLQTSTKAEADVRVFGNQTLTSGIVEYRSPGVVATQYPHGEFHNSAMAP